MKVLICFLFCLSALYQNSLCEEILYVVPSYPDPPPCPCPNGTFCETLNFVANYTENLRENDNVTAIFLCGEHTSTNQMQAMYVKLKNLFTLQIKAQQSPAGDKVVITNFSFVIENVKHFHIENVVIINVELKIYPVMYSFQSRPTVNVVNCTLNNLPGNLLVSVNVTIDNSNFLNCSTTALSVFDSNVFFKGNVSFANNSGINGGALSLSNSKINIHDHSSVQFINNSAVGVGGAIYVEGSTYVYEAYKNYSCFYSLLNYSTNSNSIVIFRNNQAKLGGSHIYGASMSSCCTGALTKQGPISTHKLLLEDVFKFFNPSLSDIVHSPVSGRPMRVCLCDELNQTQCADVSKIFLNNLTYFPGQTISLKVALVGGDFGITTGSIYFSYPSENAHVSKNIITSKCTNVNYTIYQNSINHNNELLCLSTAQSATKYCQYHVTASDSSYYRMMQNLVNAYNKSRMIHPYLLDTPIFISVSFRQCPAGFYLKSDPYYRCVCHQVLKRISKGDYLLTNKSGLVAHSSMWINATQDKIIISKTCPVEYCMEQDNYVDLQYNPDSQCGFNHSGILCGGCIANNSLAIGSSHCVYCTHNRNLAIIVFFAAAGFILVFFIGTLNLTVTHGMINSIIFYANIAWAHQGIIFSPDDELVFKPFIAWLNLDFGIEMCFFKAMDAYIKAWLQFIFPVYIWLIAGLMIAGARKSKKLTTVFGNNVVPIIDTVFFLSYMKLLRTIIHAMESIEITTYYGNHTTGHTSWVWAWDGHLNYVTSRHGVLFFVALLSLLILWLPYTLLLLLVQVLRKLSSYSPFKWVSKLYPAYDTYLAPLKPKHQYFFGVLLLIRGVIYIIVLAIPFGESHVQLFVSSIIITILFTYVVIVQPYKSKKVFLLQCCTLLNLIFLINTMLFVGAQTAPPKVTKIIVSISCSIIFLQFCFIVFHSIWNNSGCKLKSLQNILVLKKDSYRPSSFFSGRRSVVKYRDSILNESSSLLKNSVQNS